MSSNDKDLGTQVHELLMNLGIETPMLSQAYYSHTQESIAESIKHIMGMLNLDLEDDSLKETPRRVAKMYHKEIFYGLDYANFPRVMTFENKMKADEVVCIKNILVRSVCEHHLVPFIGSCHVGFIPNGKVPGLSKINRIVDFFCRRPQVQERLTEQLAATLAFVLETEDVAVVIEAEHFCVKLRGIQDPQSSTSTSKMIGKFRENPALRAEFFSLIKA